MDKFEEFVRSQGFQGEFQRTPNGQFKSDALHFMEKIWQSRQAEVDEQHKINVALNSENIKQREQITHYMNRCVETHRRIRDANKVIDKHHRYIPISTVSALEKALRGEHE